VPKNQRREMIAKVGIGSPENWHLLMRSIHQLPVPKETKQENEAKRGNKCDEEFFPVHNVFLLMVFLSRPVVRSLSQNRVRLSTRKFSEKKIPKPDRRETDGKLQVSPESSQSTKRTARCRNNSRDSSTALGITGTRMMI
jgi:hypothetical protein